MPDQTPYSSDLQKIFLYLFYFIFFAKVTQYNLKYYKLLSVVHLILISASVFLFPGGVNVSGIDTFTVCDYGAADGMNSVTFIKACRGTVRP